VILLQHSIFGLWTHFWNGKTIACSGDELCDACTANVKDVWAGYIIATALETDLTVLCAVTRPVKTDLDKYKDEEHGLFGLSVGLQRVGHRKTSPIAVKVGHRNLMHEKIDGRVTRNIILRLFADNAGKKMLEDRDL